MSLPTTAAAPPPPPLCFQLPTNSITRRNNFLSLIPFITASKLIMAHKGFETFHLHHQHTTRDHLRLVDLLNQPPQPQPQPQLSLFTPTMLPAHHQHDHHRVSLIPEFGGEFRSPVPLGPFTGYASILKRSRFLKPAQQLLEDFCGSGSSNSDPHILHYLGGRARDPVATVSDRLQVSFKNSKLTIMLEEVYKRYKLYCQQMESVVASFETIDGIGNAAPYVSYAIKAILKHFGCLKNAILDKLESKGKSTLGDCSLVHNHELKGVSKRSLHSQHPNHHQVFTNNFLHLSEIRSQRGLPESAVAVMRTWLFEHFLHPYPSDSDKQMLALQTGLSKTQVSNWFINSRVRLWKPMVEEIHNLETQQAQTFSTPDTSNTNVRSASVRSSSLENSPDLGSLPQTKRSRTDVPCDIYKQGETQRNAEDYETVTRNYLQMSTGNHEGEVSLALSLQATK